MFNFTEFNGPDSDSEGSVEVDFLQTRAYQFFSIDHFGDIVYAQNSDTSKLSQIIFTPFDDD